MNLKIKDKLKNWKWNDFLIVILIGVLLLIIAMPSSDKKSTSLVSNDLFINDNSNECATNEEERLKNILCQIEGVGKADVMIAPNNDGVVIVTEGAGNPVVEENIYEAVLALFDIEMHKIKIVKMSD